MMSLLTVGVVGRVELAEVRKQEGGGGGGDRVETESLLCLPPVLKGSLPARKSTKRAQRVRRTLNGQ